MASREPVRRAMRAPARALKLVETAKINSAVHYAPPASPCHIGRPASWQTALALQKPRESGERDIGHMMLDALGIEFRALLRNADGAQNIDNEPMPVNDLAVVV